MAKFLLSNLAKPTSILLWFRKKHHSCFPQPAAVFYLLPDSFVLYSQTSLRFPSTYQLLHDHHYYSTSPIWSILNVLSKLTIKLSCFADRMTLLRDGIALIVPLFLPHEIHSWYQSILEPFLSTFLLSINRKKDHLISPSNASASTKHPLFSYNSPTDLLICDRSHLPSPLTTIFTTTSLHTSFTHLSRRPINITYISTLVYSFHDIQPSV